MVYTRQTQLFWRSMQPLVHRVVGDALTRCGLRPVVKDPVLHFRCASAPINRKSMYHFQRYAFYRAEQIDMRRVDAPPLYFNDSAVSIGLVLENEEMFKAGAAVTCRVHGPCTRCS